MAKYRDPFSDFNDGQSTYQEFHFGSAEEARQFFEGQRRKQRPKGEIRSHIFQGYKDVYPGRWKEISKEDIKKDIGRLPKIMDAPFYYVIRQNRDYFIEPCYSAIILYDHNTDTFVYMRADGSLILEKNIFASNSEAKDRLLKMHKKYEGAVTAITFPDGHTVELEEPIWPSDHKKNEGEDK